MQQHHETPLTPDELDRLQPLLDLIARLIARRWVRDQDTLQNNQDQHGVGDEPAMASRRGRQRPKAARFRPQSEDNPYVELG